MSKLKSGLIQMSLKGSTEDTPEKIRDAMLEAHLPLIDKAGAEGVQVLCFQEVFTQPYFCPSQDDLNLVKQQKSIRSSVGCVAKYLKSTSFCIFKSDDFSSGSSKYIVTRAFPKKLNLGSAKLPGIERPR